MCDTQKKLQCRWPIKIKIKVFDIVNRSYLMWTVFSHCNKRIPYGFTYSSKNMAVMWRVVCIMTYQLTFISFKYIQLKFVMRFSKNVRPDIIKHFEIFRNKCSNHYVTILPTPVINNTCAIIRHKLSTSITNKTTTLL